MDQRPLVSVIVPAYNMAAYVRPTLASALAQTYGRLEIFVVDDGSTDATGEVVEAVAATDARVRLLRQENRGVAAARNRAIAASSGPLIAPLDADDVWHPEKIERQVRAMQRGGPSVGLVYSWSVFLDERGRFAGKGSRLVVEEGAYEALLYKNFLGNGSAPLMRRCCVEEAGGYDESLRARGGEGSEDRALAMRIAERHAFRVAPGYLVGYRQVEGSMSQNYDAMARSHELILEEVRRRHPEIPRRVLRLSHARKCFWLATVNHTAGRYEKTLRWGRKAVQADPWVLFSGLARLLVQSAARQAAGRATHEDGAGNGRRAPNRPAVNGSARAGRRGENNERPFPVWPVEAQGEAQLPWDGWKPYNRIWRRRWRRATTGASRPGAASPNDRFLEPDDEGRPRDQSALPVP